MAYIFEETSEVIKGMDELQQDMSQLLRYIDEHKEISEVFDHIGTLMSVMADKYRDISNEGIVYDYAMIFIKQIPHLVAERYHTTSAKIWHQ